jgi:hypothetical protein
LWSLSISRRSALIGFCLWLLLGLIWEVWQAHWPIQIPSGISYRCPFGGRSHGDWCGSLKSRWSSWSSKRSLVLWYVHEKFQ